MSDEYQAVYDAVSHRICNLDIDVKSALASIACELKRPVSVMRPTISMDGDKWCFLLGENLQDGLCSFGDSPAEAAYNFDRLWFSAAKARGES